MIEENIKKFNKFKHKFVRELQGYISDKENWEKVIVKSKEVDEEIELLQAKINFMNNIVEINNINAT